MSQVRRRPHINDIVIQWTILTTGCTIPVAAHDNGMVTHYHETVLKREEKFRLNIVRTIYGTENNNLTVKGDLLHQEVVQVVLLLVQDLKINRMFN